MLNQLKSEYLTTICHEIRTPLNGLTGALELLKRSELNCSQTDLVELAVQCSDGLLEVINNVLDFSRIEAGQVELTLQSAELLPILDQAMLTIAPKAATKSIHLRMLVTKTVPFKSIVDRIKVKQILTNLLGNAIKLLTKVISCCMSTPTNIASLYPSKIPELAYLRKCYLTFLNPIPNAPMTP